MRLIGRHEETISGGGTCVLATLPGGGYAKITRCGAIRAMDKGTQGTLAAGVRQDVFKVGRPSIPPEQLLRALLLQMLYSVRSERLVVEEIDYNILFRWFVGLIWTMRCGMPTVFTKNRDRC